MNDDVRPALADLLVEMQQALHALFTHIAGAAKRRRRGPVQRRLLLGLELLMKLEEQLVLPALADAAPPHPALLAEAQHEIELMRDVALLVTQTARANREVSLAVLEGLAFLHFTHVNEQVVAARLAPAHWARLEAEARRWLERWQAEVHDSGDIDDEDGDPVGTPPA